MYRLLTLLRVPIFVRDVVPSFCRYAADSEKILSLPASQIWSMEMRAWCWRLGNTDAFVADGGRLRLR